MLHVLFIFLLKPKLNQTNLKFNLHQIKWDQHIEQTYVKLIFGTEIFPFKLGDWK